MKRGESSTADAPTRDSGWDAMQVRSRAASGEYKRQKTAKVVEWLDRFALTIRYSDYELYYGRGGDGSGKFDYDPEFENSGNKTGNGNFQKIDAFNVTFERSAKRYAAYKAQKNAKSSNPETQARSNPEIFRMTTENPDARLIDAENVDFSKLSESEKRDFQKAVKSSLPEVLEACPLDFVSRGTFNVSTLRSDLFKTLSEASVVPDRAKAFGLSEGEAKRIVSAINTKYLLENAPLQSIKAMLRCMLKDKSEIKVDGKNYPFSKEYFSSYLKDLGIIGMHRRLTSHREFTNPETGKREEIGDFHSFYVFEQSEIDVAENNERKRDTRNRIFGKIALRMNGILHGRGGEMKKKAGVIGELEGRMYASPHEIIEKAKTVSPWIKSAYEMDAGNTEHYTLEEHTETAMRIFDDNFADKLPAGVLPAARLALLVHDIGKPFSAALSGNTKNQSPFNEFYAAKFMEEAGVDEDTRKFVSDLIGKGLHASGPYAHHQDKESLERLRKVSAEIARDHFGNDNLRDNSNGVFDLIMALQTCDSGAYTRMARTTHRGEDGTVIYQNRGTFDKSFEKSGLSGRRVKLKRALEKRLRRAA